MKGELVIIQPTGTIARKPLDHTPKLEELKEGIGGGYIETVPYFNTFEKQKCVAFCDEEGKFKGFSYNPIAHMHWEIAVRKEITNDYLVGPICIVIGDDELLRAL